MFKLRQDVYHTQIRHAVLDNTLTVKIGDIIVPVAASAGVVTNATAAVAGAYFPLGVVVGFTGPQGQVVGQGQASVGSVVPAQVTTIGTNTSAAYTGQLTGGQISAEYVPITEEMEFIATMNHAAGTTQAYSGLAFTWYNLADAATVDETSVLLNGNASVPLQVFAVPNGSGPATGGSSALDPLDPTNTTIIVKFAKMVMARP